MVGVRNKIFILRMWKPLPSRRVLKTLKGNPKGEAQREQYLLAVDLDCYKSPRKKIHKIQYLLESARGVRGVGWGDEFD